MTTIPLVGASYTQRSIPFDAQRSLNLFPVADPQGKAVSALYGRPGLNLLGVVGTGPGRGEYAASNGRAFVVSGNGLYEVFANGSSLLRGTLDQSNGLVTIDENGFQLAVCDGFSLYIFTYATNVFQKVSSPNLPNAATVTFIDGYFIVNRVNSGIFQISKIYDGLTWAALDFATAESSPDNLLRVLNVVGQLWLFGTKTTEVWSNNGGASFPFAKIGGGKLETGIIGAFAALALDNSAFWLGRDNNGSGIIYRAEGFTPQRISTEPIEIRLQAAPDPDKLRFSVYQEDGHVFLIIQGGGMETDIVYDLSTQLFHERCFLNQFGNYEPHLPAAYMFAFGKTICIDRTNGNLYEQKLGIYTDNGGEIACERTYQHLSQENVRFTINDLTIAAEVGVGNNAGDVPLITMYLSRNGGRSWSDGLTKSLGKIGEYLTRVVFWRLGQSRNLTFRIRVTSKVKVALIASYINTGGK